jgi:hypothetical protein
VAELATALIAATLLAWLRLLAVDGPLAAAEPKNPRYRILDAAARLVCSGRRRRLKVAAAWPWATALVTAWHPEIKIHYAAQQPSPVQRPVSVNHRD